MENLKDIINKILGKKVHKATVTVVEPWTNKRTRLSFNLEIESAYLDDILKITFNITNRLVNGEIDDDEFEWQFTRRKFQEEFKEDTYDNFKLDVFGVGVEDLEVDFIYS